MKLNLDRIPREGVILEEDIAPCELDLEVEGFSLEGPLSAKAEASRITNAVHIELEIRAKASVSCTRCLNDFHQDINRRFVLDHEVQSGERELDLDPEIRQELILSLPVKRLCKPDCRGLCIKCGTNLNEKKCTCTIEQSS